LRSVGYTAHSYKMPAISARAYAYGDASIYTTHTLYQRQPLALETSAGSFKLEKSSIAYLVIFAIVIPILLIGGVIYCLSFYGRPCCGKRKLKDLPPSPSVGTKYTTRVRSNSAPKGKLRKGSKSKCGSEDTKWADSEATLVQKLPMPNWPLPAAGLVRSDSGVSEGKSESSTSISEGWLIPRPYVVARDPEGLNGEREQGHDFTGLPTVPKNCL
jgi:hypothetical protein